MWIGKKDGTLQCGMGAEIPLKVMEAELVHLEIRAANREKRHWPGYIPLACGLPTGACNAYDIADKDWATHESRLKSLQYFQWPKEEEARHAAPFAARGDEDIYPIARSLMMIAQAVTARGGDDGFWPWRRSSGGDWLPWPWIKGDGGVFPHKGHRSGDDFVPWPWSIGPQGDGHIGPWPWSFGPHGDGHIGPWPWASKSLVGKLCRVYRTGDPLTDDFLHDRVNIELGADGRIVKVWFG